MNFRLEQEEIIEEAGRIASLVSTLRAAIANAEETHSRENLYGAVCILETCMYNHVATMKLLQDALNEEANK